MSAPKTPYTFPLRWLALAAVLLAQGCGGGGTVDPGPSGPAWLAGLPQRAVEAAPGETVWAVVPQAGSESATLSTYRVESAAGKTAVLVDALGNRLAEVPGALIHSAPGAAEPAEGDVVLADRWDADRVVGRVAAAEGAAQVAFDWNGVTETGAMDAMRPLATGGDSLALRWVGYRSAPDGPWFKGLCFAESDEQLWIADDSGQAVIVARDAVKTLSDLGAELAAGDEVSAYSWGHGYRSGRVAEVLEPGLRYAVELEGGEVRAFFFENLTQVL